MALIDYQRKVIKTVDLVNKNDYSKGVTSKELKRMLAAQGANFTHGKGSHLKVTLNGKKSVIPEHKGDLPAGTLNAILKQLGLKE